MTVCFFHAGGWLEELQGRQAVCCLAGSHRTQPGSLKTILEDNAASE